MVRHFTATFHPVNLPVIVSWVELEKLKTGSLTKGVHRRML
jgi:hypothetical protein